MKRTQAVSHALIASVTLWIGCSKDASAPASPAQEASRTTDVAGSGPRLYQCSMHPNIISERPGKCPICAMDLQPVSRIKAEGIPGRGAVQLSPRQEQLINIRVASVVSAPAVKTIRALGTIGYDQTKVHDVNSRVMGWVERLYVDKPGEFVKTGQPLMALYSPELYSAQQEYLLAFQQAHPTATTNTAASPDVSGITAAKEPPSSASLLTAARKRLELWNISDAQIGALEKSGTPQNTMELAAPASGFVIRKNVLPGQMIQAGALLYRIADLSKVWLEAEVYEDELRFIKVGQTATVTVVAYPSRPFQGTVDFIYPYLDKKTRTARVRLVFPNPDHLLLPQMYGSVVLAEELGEQLLVPATAVFNTGKRQYAFVQKQPGLFLPKEIQLGAKTDGRFVVTHGLEPGDQVVVDGNFLLDSESQLKAAAQGSAEHIESPRETSTTHPEMVHPLPVAASALFQPLVDDYLRAADLLQRDRTTGLQTVADKMAEDVGRIRASAIRPSEEAGQYEKQLRALADHLRGLEMHDLPHARIGFGQLSASLIALVGHFPPPLHQPLTIVFCPMWKKSPARWLQIGQQIQNPFMGQKMPACGEVVATLGTGQ